MKLLNLSPMLYTVSLEESIAFYTSKLGFTAGGQSVEDGWASLFKDEVEIMFSLPNAHLPFKEPVFTGSFYFRTDNVDELWNKLKDDVKVVYELENFDYGMREFAIYDNNGYILQFGENIEV
jgi:catechol 2,3-dioxygenase-like lactoylglutathione lyase family enzyme